MTPSGVRKQSASKPGDGQAPMTRTQRRAAATRQAIVDAARELVATRGTDALTLDAVSESADVAVQTIYNRVGGRSALLTAVAEQAMRESRVYMDAAYDAEGTAEERLLLAAAAYAKFARERPHEFRILVEPPDEPDAVAHIAELTGEQNAKLAATIRAGMADGSARSDLDPDDLATAFWATLNGLLALAWRPGALRADHDRLDRLLATYIATVADGLRSR
ncbi:putative TetR family transcriptional regulator [Gordonia sihwensis NBRC 108236]|uniref:HTH tetR-type domain-containing protein n=3 Tax=Gordoniaceae TaxID=85026 RepID=A0ABN3HZ85_9ACTN|nr:MULTISPECIES: TetR/AcrR family transcriptional regulator [Gordonia]WFN94765.1 TetR/AcrR family transcriptional regulator [Gordonia sihwensis]GAC59724.1 putative TetR family transcriptional regulator [Gordonia sihwensis NBRC 108236]